MAKNKQKLKNANDNSFLISGCVFYSSDEASVAEGREIVSNVAWH